MINLKEKIEEGLVFITHKNCMDGTFSAIAMKYYENIYNLNNVEYVFMQYGDEVPDVEGKHVIMCDYSLKREAMLDMANSSKSIVVLDHHMTAKEEIGDLDFVRFDNNHSGCVLAWKYLIGDDVPKIFSYVEDRDLWRWELSNSKEVSSGLKQYSSQELLNITPGIILSNGFFDNVLNKGTIINAYENKYIAGKANHDNDFIKIDIEGSTIEVPILNNSYLISDVGNAIATDSYYNISVQYFITEDSIVFSFRSIGDVDVGRIAKYFGGGGHMNAAGCSFKIDDFDFNRFFKTKTLSKDVLDIKE